MQGSAAAEPAALARDAEGGVREGLEPFPGDLLPALLADPVGAGRDTREGRVDLFDRRTGLRAQREIAFPLHGEGVTLTRLLVELDVARLPLLGQEIGLGLERLRLAGVGGPLCHQGVAL